MNHVDCILLNFLLIEKDEEEDDNEKEEEDMDKQIGDADGEDNKKLDDRMWGSDDEDEPEEKKVIDETIVRGSGGLVYILFGFSLSSYIGYSDFLQIRITSVSL